MAEPARELEIGTLYRSAPIDRAAVDEETRSVTLSFSSEEPVDRFFGTEILDHGRKSVDLRRLNSGGAVLVDHRTSDHVGVVEKAWIEDRRGLARVRFGKSARASEVFDDIRDGIRTHVSVGYRVHALKLVESGDQGDVFRVTRWEPLEVSIVAVPADPTVGVGRADDHAKSIVTINTEEGPMPDNPNTDSAAAEPRAAPEPQPAAADAHVRSEARAEPRPQASEAAAEAHLREERRRIDEILALGERFDRRELAREAIRDGASIEAFRKRILESLDNARPIDLRASESPEIGLTPREARAFSFVRAIRAALTRDWSDAGFEREVSRATVDKLGLQPRGDFVVPYDVMVASRTLTAGTAGAGGELVATDHLAGSFIELLRNRMVVRQLGARVLDGLTGDVSIPKQTGGATASWVAEDAAAATASELTTGNITLAPKTVTCWSDISRRLILQSSPAIEDLVRSDLATAIALAIDLAAINGSGASNEPTGILNTTGIGDVAGGTNGAAPTWQNIVDLEKLVATANADIGALAYLTNAKVRGALKTTEKASGTAQFVWQDGSGGTPGEGAMNGYRALVSNQVPSNLTKGTGTGLSAILFGNWSELLIGLWGALDVLVDPYTNSTAGRVRIVNHQDADIAVRHAESFAAMQDAIA